ncbi:hypothetical protein [Arundinibacter roseus]|uniref:Uncharacterized protein n=1 Tax=Arundinibacter roseus TaxID=2070510 RepID=A0A4R4KJ16_9BACT|nr:hypothetical protein [Arundinibacter roseus]TDB68267.1 hypothetical protein EZE20_04940 [Arundinibacter roseus]
MARILIGIVLFCILAYTIGYFMVWFQKPVKSDGTPKTPFEVGSKILILMLGIVLIGFLLFAAYTFMMYAMKDH